MYPADVDATSGKSFGVLAVEVATPSRGKNIFQVERIKTCLRSVSGRTCGRPDERINSSDAGRMTRNWVKVFKVHQT